MSRCHIPFEIHIEIIKRLPIKSLIRFRCVSKPWKSLIDSSEFNTEYSNVQPQRLLMMYADEDKYRYPRSYVSIVDDDTNNFPQHKFSLKVPMLKLGNWSVVSTSHGLFCFYGYTNMAIIWNPSIRKSVDIVFDCIPTTITVVGFGVCPHTLDPKIVKIPHRRRPMNIRYPSCNPTEVKVYTLNSKTWRRPYRNLPRDSIGLDIFECPQVVNGLIYWLACDRITMDDGYRYNNLIISFDVTSEVFKEVCLPDCLTPKPQMRRDLSISKLRESLIVLEPSADYDVWMMLTERGVSTLFRKLYVIKAPAASILPVVLLGFRKSGAPVLEIKDEDDSKPSALAIYEPYSKNISEIGIQGIKTSFVLRSYKETLLLLDQPDSNVYSDKNLKRKRSE